MDQRYLSSNGHADTIIDVLSSNDVRRLQENRYRDINCLLSSLARAVTSAISDVSRHLMVPGVDGAILTGERPVIQSIQQLGNVSREITHLCYHSSERNQNKALIPTNRPLLTQLYTVGVTEQISENDSKSISPFCNVGADAELKCEIFLQDIVNLAKSKQLSQVACKNLFYRKLAASARSLFDSHLDLHETEYSDVSLENVFKLAEYLYMAKSNPRAALLSLSKLPKMAAHDKNFQKVQSVISRLCKISVLDEPNQAVRGVLYQTRCLSTFNSAITQRDRAMLESANTGRAASNLDPLTLAGSLQFLTQFYQDEQVNQEAPTFAAPGSLSTLQVQAEEDPYNMNWVPRGGPRGAQRGGRGAGEQRPHYIPAVAQPRGHPPQQQRGGRGYQGPGRGAQPTRGRGQYSGGAPAAGRGAGQHRSPPGAWEANNGAYRIPRDMVMDPTELGIKPNTCFACGSSTHNYTQRDCQYFGTRLYPRKCRNCQCGGHQNTICTGKKSGERPVKPRHTRTAQIEEIPDGEGEEYDFMFSTNQ